MVNLPTNFDDEAYNGSISIVFTLLFPLWPWPLTSNFEINKVHPLVIVNVSAKFNEDAHSGLVSIVFTILKRADTRTDGTTPELL